MMGSDDLDKVESTEKPKRKSNIEKWMDATDAQTLHKSRVAGAYASHPVRSAKKAVSDKLQKLAQTEDIPSLMQTMLLGDLPENQRDYVRSIVPDYIPDDSISPIVAMTYSCVSDIITHGDTRSLQQLLQMSGQTAELKVKLDINADINADGVIDVKGMSTAELQRLCGRQIIDAEPEEGCTQVALPAPEDP